MHEGQKFKYLHILGYKMIEITEEKLDAITVKVVKNDVKYFKKAELEQMEIRMTTELQKVKDLLEVLK